MLEFSHRHQDFYGFYRGEVKSDGILIEWKRDVAVLVAISSPLILVEKSVVKLQMQQSRGYRIYSKERLPRISAPFLT